MQEIAVSFSSNNPIVKGTFAVEYHALDVKDDQWFTLFSLKHPHGATFCVVFFMQVTVEISQTILHPSH